MGGSNTGRTNQVNTTEIHTAVNNQDLSSDKKINDVTNIRNYDIVHGNDIGGGMNTFNGLTNTASGTQVFKLQELETYEEIMLKAKKLQEYGLRVKKIKEMRENLVN